MEWIISLIKELYGYIKPRVRVQFQVKTFEKYIVVKNISKVTAYSVDISASNDTFWTFQYTKHMDFEPDREVRIPFTLVKGHNSNGAITITYKDKYNNGEEVIFPVTV